jgi:hypothetical protein
MKCGRTVEANTTDPQKNEDQQQDIILQCRRDKVFKGRFLIASEFADGTKDELWNKSAVFTVMNTGFKMEFLMHFVEEVHIFASNGLGLTAEDLAELKVQVVKLYNLEMMLMSGVLFKRLRGRLPQPWAQVVEQHVSV